MPSSILKYLDIARLVGVGLKCPVCNGTDCRHSKWHSKNEKLGSDGLRPYRCNDCTHRFLASNNASVERIMLNVTAGVLLGFGVLVGVDIWQEVVNEPKNAASTAHSGESTTGAAARLLTGPVVADDSKDQAARAQQQQEAAERGDVAAMLHLGRDLATGNNRPKDVEQAAHWVQLAAATGNSEAMLELGRFYRDGLGVRQDSVRAYAWLSRAAAKDPGALLERDTLVRTMNEAQLKEAHQLLSLPAELAWPSSVGSSDSSGRSPRP